MESSRLPRSRQLGVLERELLDLVEQATEPIQRLISIDFEGVDGLWRIERSIIQFQISLQDRIRSLREAKAQLRRDIRHTAKHKAGNWRETMETQQQELGSVVSRTETLRYVRGLSRRAGDAFAHLLLCREDGFVGSCSENSISPGIPHGHGLHGVLATAESLAGKHVGFPIVHDMTTALRVGDITFVHPDKQPLTVEVKTRLRERTRKTEKLEVDVSAFLDEEQASDLDQALTLRVNPKAPTAANARAKSKQRSPRGRHLRQLERMKRARASRQAVTQEKHRPGADLVGTPVVPVSVKRVERHWDALQRVTAQAKQSGYASTVADGAFMYVAAFREEPFLTPWAKCRDLPFVSQAIEELPASGIFMEDTSRNALVFGSLLELLDGHVRPKLLPLLLYPLPFEVLKDILCCRMIVFTFLNVGRVVEALESAGYQAALPESKKDAQTDFVKIRRTVGDGSSNSLVCEIRNMGTESWRLIHEFMSIGSFVEMVDSMFAAITSRLPVDR